MQMAVQVTALKIKCSWLFPDETEVSTIAKFVKQLFLSDKEENFPLYTAGRFEIVSGNTKVVTQFLC